MNAVWHWIGIILFCYIITATVCQVWLARRRPDDDFFGGSPKG